MMKSKPERRQGNVAAFSELSSTCPSGPPHAKRWSLRTYLSLWQTLKYHLVSWWPLIDCLLYVIVIGDASSREIPTLFQVEIYQPFGLLGYFHLGKVLYGMFGCRSCHLFVQKNPPRWNMVIRSWQLQYPCHSNGPNGCKTFMRGFMGVSGKAQSAGGEGEVLFSVPWIWLVVFVFFWFWWWWCGWWCLQFGGITLDTLMMMLMVFITPNTANRYMYVVLYPTLVKFHLTVAISMDCVNLVRGKRVQSNKKGAAAPTSRPILYMRTVSSTYCSDLWYLKDKHVVSVSIHCLTIKYNK